MKRICVGVFMFTFFAISTTSVKAQYAGNANTKITVIEPYKMTIGLSKTSNIIFPYEIKSVDVGSNEVLAQIANGTENIVQIKAATENFKQTNLSVVTADGRFYSFVLDYASNPPALNLFLGKDSLQVKETVSLTGVTVTEDKLYNAVPLVKRARNFLDLSIKQQRMKASLQGIYIHKEVMWFKFLVKNKSLINFEPGKVRFLVKDKIKAKRTSIQEKEIYPLFTYPSSAIKYNNKNHIIIGLSPFTIPKNQKLNIQIEEKNGGRSLLFSLPHKVILKAKTL
jgi:conjugative transposon TraN protein